MNILSLAYVYVFNSDYVFPHVHCTCTGLLNCTPLYIIMTVIITHFTIGCIQRHIQQELCIQHCRLQCVTISNVSLTHGEIL